MTAATRATPGLPLLDDAVDVVAATFGLDEGQAAELLRSRNRTAWLVEQRDTVIALAVGAGAPIPDIAAALNRDRRHVRAALVRWAIRVASSPAARSEFDTLAARYTEGAAR